MCALIIIIITQVSGNAKPREINSFEEAKLRPFVVENIKKSGYTRPTPIQKHSIPIILAGRDVMACAQTGSGKTVSIYLSFYDVNLNFLGDTYCHFLKY